MTGVLAIVLLCLPLSLLLQAAYRHTDSILAPALLHGLMNKAAQTAMVLLLAEPRVDWLVTGLAGLRWRRCSRSRPS